MTWYGHLKSWSSFDDYLWMLLFRCKLHHALFWGGRVSVQDRGRSAHYQDPSSLSLAIKYQILVTTTDISFCTRLKVKNLAAFRTANYNFRASVDDFALQLLWPSVLTCACSCCDNLLIASKDQLNVGKPVLLCLSLSLLDCGWFETYCTQYVPILH